MNENSLRVTFVSVWVSFFGLVVGFFLGFLLVFWLLGFLCLLFFLSFFFFSCVSCFGLLFDHLFVWFAILIKHSHLILLKDS